MKFLVTVIIPSWNGRHLLKTCLSSIQKQTLKDFEVIVVDNGSSDGSIDYIEKNFSKVRVIKLEKNYGFAKAINFGIKEAKGDFIVLINNDTEVGRQCLHYLVQAAKQHPEVGFVAAKMLNYYQRDVIDSAGDYLDEVGHANNIGLGKKDGPIFDQPGYVFLATGGGGLFKRKVFDRVGLFDENYFAYFEDVDLCLRAQFQGIKGWYEPKAIIYHIHKATSSKNLDLLEYLQFRNMTQTIIKNFPSSILLKKWRWLKIILVHFNTIFYQLRNGFFWSPFFADLWILFHIQELLRERRRIQSNKRVSDEYIESFLKEKKITFWKLVK